MRLIKTKSFKLAIIDAGNEKADKLAILIPGRLDTKDYAQNFSHINFLANMGYYALSFDPPGTWDSSGDINLYTMTNCIKAVNEIIELFGNRPTILMGHSMGGSVALLAGPNNPAVSDIVSINSGSGGRTVVDRAEPGKVTISYRDIPPVSNRTPEKKRRRFYLPYSFFEDRDKYDASDELLTCTKPKLLFYSKNDKIVPPKEVLDLYKAASSPKYKYELNSDHDYRLHPEIIDIVNKVLAEFLKGSFKF